MEHLAMTIMTADELAGMTDLTLSQYRQGLADKSVVMLLGRQRIMNEIEKRTYEIQKRGDHLSATAQAQRCDTRPLVNKIPITTPPDLSHAAS